MKQHPLKVERVLRGWSQAKVAEALNTTVRTICRWEQGQALPYPFYREQLCQLFGKDARQLGLLPELEEGKSLQPEEPLSPQSPSPAPVPASSLPLSPALADPTIPEALGSASGPLGREHMLRQAMRQLLEKGRLAIYGLPGIGKTTLTVALATDPQVQAHFHDGILWAGLGPQPNILGLLVRWGKLLEIEPGDVENASSKEDWRRALQAAIGQRCMLVVIDDAWSINDVLALQVGGVQCTYLLTTRQPQIAFAFAQERTIALHELSEADGLALLMHFVPQLVRQEGEEARTLVHEVGGLPLALTLMGKYLATQFLPGQPHRIRRALMTLHQAAQRLKVSSLDTFSSNLPIDMPLSLYAAISVSDQRLSPSAHRALCALSVFPAKPDSFAEEAALAVCEEPIEILDELWDAGLLESSGPGRYCLHQTIVNYAQTQAENSSAKQRLVHYMLTYVNAHQQDYEILEREANILWAAISAAVELEMWADLVRGGIALTPFLHVRGLYSQANYLLQQALHATLKLEDHLASAVVFYHLADFADLLGDHSDVEIYGRQGLELARRLGQQDLESSFLYILGRMCRKRGDYTQARRLLEDGLRLARLLNDLECICHLLNDLGAVSRHQSDYSQANIYYSEALALARQTEAQELISLQLASLSILEQEQGHYDQAEVYCMEGIQLAWQVGYREQLCFHLNTLGLIAIHRGVYSQAEAYYQEALVQARRIGHRANICISLLNLGDLSGLRGDYAQAEIYCLEGVELARQMDFRLYLAALLLNLGYAIGQQGAYQRAIICFQECLEIGQQLQDARLINKLTVLWGEIHLKYQQLDAATSTFSEVLLSACDDSEQDFCLRALAQYGLARIAALRGAITEAQSLGEECAAILARLGHSKAGEVRYWLTTISSDPTK